jgi:4-amino-4-deoxy-L-arabinose transferase-like glycosyltransferase
VLRLAAIAALLALLFLYLPGIASFGLIGPDEPRYASIGRDMARSGDWITPRLWGSPWFEKPALLYWMIGGAFRLGLDEDYAPRLPVALFSIACLIVFYWRLQREFGVEIAAIATAVLATSALWIGFSHAAATDLPMAATFALAVFFLLPEIEGRSSTANRAAAGALLGLSVLAKGLVPVVLLIPFLWFTRTRWRSWFNPAAWVAFFVVALPWYILVTTANAQEFWKVFFLEHQLGRFASGALRHVQPFWFYVPVMIAALFPWTLFLPFVGRRGIYTDRRLRFLAAIVIFGFVFFSASRNKLPGYVLPLIAPLCVLIAAGIRDARRSHPRALGLVTTLSVLLLPLFIVAAGVLPGAFSGGNLFPIDLLTASRVAASVPIIVIGGATVIFLDRLRALALFCVLAVAGWAYIEWAALPWVDRAASARPVWRAIPEPRDSTCVDPGLNRNWRYGFNFYAGHALPPCDSGRWNNRLLAGPGDRPMYSR